MTWLPVEVLRKWIATSSAGTFLATIRVQPKVVGIGRTDRVVRGGSFNNNRRNARAAARNNNNPGNRNNNLGLRVAVAHTSPLPPAVLTAHGRQSRRKKRDGRPRPWLRFLHPSPKGEVE